MTIHFYMLSLFSDNNTFFLGKVLDHSRQGAWLGSCGGWT
jgi:hypothetical protein